MSEPSFNPYGAVDLSALANKAQQPPANSQARASGVVVDVTEEKFGELVELSNTVPVLVDLWSARTEQSTQLSTLLEKTAVEYAGKFLHAKVDVDASPQIAQAFQVQAIPTVIALLQGKPVPLFQGLVSEEQLQQVLGELFKIAQESGVTGTVPGVEGTEEEEEEEAPLPPLHQEAFDAIERDDLPTAVSAYEKALTENPRDDQARAGLAQVRLLQRTRDVDLAQARQAAADDPSDLEAQLLAADLDVLGGAVEDAFLRLLETIRASAGEERNRVREHMLALFEVVGGSDARVVKARRDLTNALY